MQTISKKYIVFILVLCVSTILLFLYSNKNTCPKIQEKQTCNAISACQWIQPMVNCAIGDDNCPPDNLGECIPRNK